MRVLGCVTITNVVESWENARQTSAFEENLGWEMMKNLFTLEPRTKAVFGFPEDFNIATCGGLKRMGLLIHARRMIDMFHGVVQLLGPQQDELTEMLAKVGADHLKYGVRPSFLSVMGQALVLALADTLGDKWTPAYEASWRLLYEELSADMVASMYEVQQAKIQAQQARIDKKNKDGDGDNHSKMSGKSQDSTRTTKSRDSTRSSKSRDSTSSGMSTSTHSRSERQKGRRRERTSEEKKRRSEKKKSESDHSEKENCEKKIPIETAE